jgi:hypothetical protein
MPVFQQPMGIGRGMINNSVPAPAPQIPGPHRGQGDANGEDLAPLRLPGQTAPAPLKFADAEQSVVTNGGGNHVMPGTVSIWLDVMNLSSLEFKSFRYFKGGQCQSDKNDQRRVMGIMAY